jgi:hypothetical protein
MIHLHLLLIFQITFISNILYIGEGRTPSGFANALEIFHQCSMTAADADPTRGARNASLIV